MLIKLSIDYDIGRKIDYDIGPKCTYRYFNFFAKMASAHTQYLNKLK
jgi:hypothetical protein